MTLGATLVAIAVALLRDPGDRRVGVWGLAALALGLAADRTAPLVQAPVIYATVTFGLLVLGIGLSVAAVARAVRRDSRRMAPALAAIVAGNAVILWGLLPLLTPAALVRSGVVAVAMGAAGLLTGMAARRFPLGRALRRRERQPATMRPAGLAIALAATLVAGFSSHVVPVLVAGITASWAVWFALPRGGRRIPAAALAVTLALLTSLWLLTTIRGPEGLALSAIPSLPVSPAAERLLGLLLLTAAVGLCGPWPLRQPVDGLLTATVGALLVARVALPAVPDGLEHWRAGALPLIVVGLWHAALVRRPAALAVLGACLGLVTLRAEGVTGAGWLLASGVAVRVLSGRSGVLVGRALVAVAVWWGVQDVLSAGLATETAYTVLAAVGGALGAAGGRAELGSPGEIAR